MGFVMWCSICTTSALLVRNFQSDVIFDVPGLAEDGMTSTVRTMSEDDDDDADNNNYKD